MTDRNATIRMPKESLAKWLEALRSGEYKQGKEVLYEQSDNSYCCLGVLQHCLTGKVEHFENHTKECLAYPTTEWLEANNVEFIYVVPDQRYNNAPYLPSLGITADVANDQEIDGCVYTFAQIADAIEACSEGT